LKKLRKKSLNTAQLSAPERRKRTLFKDSLPLLHVPIDSEAITLTTPGEQLKDKERMLDFGQLA
jgi:hypothetical protein